MVFADAFYWIASTNQGDQFSEAARQFDHLFLNGPVYTTDEVLTEFLAFFAGDRWLKTRAAKTVREILSDPAVIVIPQSHASFRSGLDFYEARPDKGYSLTDCISMQAMRMNKVTEVLTNDRHFEQEGFRVLFRNF